MPELVPKPPLLEERAVRSGPWRRWMVPVIVLWAMSALVTVAAVEPGAIRPMDPAGLFVMGTAGGLLLLITRGLATVLEGVRIPEWMLPFRGRWARWFLAWVTLCGIALLPCFRW